MPTIDSAFVQLTFKVSERPVRKTDDQNNVDPLVRLDPLVSIALTGVHVREALELAVRTGKGDILRQLKEYFLNTPYFDSTIVATAKARFSQLRPEHLPEGPPSEETVRRLVSPMLMVLLHRPALLEWVMEEYFELCEEGAAFLESKLEVLFQNILKSRDSLEAFCRYLFGKFRAAPESPRVLNLLRSLVGMIKSHPEYRAFVQILFHFARSDPAFFARFRPTLDVQVAFDFIVFVYETDPAYFAAHVRPHYQDWNLRLEDFFKFTAFTNKQAKHFDLCTRFCNDLIAWHAADLAPRALYQGLLNEYKKREAREFPVMLAYIALQFARREKERGGSVDDYLEAFKRGIEKGQCSNPLFWNVLVQYSRLDGVLAREAIRPLLPEAKQSEFIRQVTAH